MNKRLFRKIMAAVLTAALLLSNSGLLVSAADKVMVENVYTNFQKATMASGTTKQITTYTEPENATNQGMYFTTSNSKVAKVSQTGLVTAVAPGKAVITAKAKDGSGKKETVTIKVLDNLVIKKAMVDADNEIIVMDKTYGNITIDESIGDAVVYFSGITVKNKLTLDSGDYSLNVYDSVVKTVEVNDVKDGITSLAVSESGNGPELNFLGGSNVSNLLAQVGFTLNQDPSARIFEIELNQSTGSNLQALLAGFTGNIVIVGGSSGAITLNTVNCNIPNVEVNGSSTGNITFNNNNNSNIQNLNIIGGTNINLNAPVENLNIGNNISGTNLNLNAPVQNLTNGGLSTSINIGSTVGYLVSTDKGSTIVLVEGGLIEEQKDIVSNIVDMSKVGTTTVKAGAYAAAAPTAQVNVNDVIISNDYENSNYSFIKRGPVTFFITNSGNNSSKALMVTGRTASWNGPALSLANYVPSKIGKHVTITYSVDVMHNSSTSNTIDIKGTVDGTYASIGTVTATKGVWTTLTGTYKIAEANSLIYFETASNDDLYFDNLRVTVSALTDIVKVTGVTLDATTATMGIGEQKQLTPTVAPSTADNKAVIWYSSNPVVASVNSEGKVTANGGGTCDIYVQTVDGNYMNKCTITVDPTIMIYKVDITKSNKVFTTLNDSLQLTARVTLNTAPITATVTWSSSDSSVASVSSTGLVTAVGNGSATITSSATLGGETYTDTFAVTVNSELLLISDFESDNIGTGYTGTGWSASDMDASVVQVSEADINKALSVHPKNWNAGVVLNVTLPAGKTLGDYSHVSVKALWKSGDVTYKSLVAEADTTVTGGFDHSSGAARKLGSVSNNLGAANSAFTNYLIPISGDKTSLSGTFQIALGINCNGSGSNTVYYLDDIGLVKKPAVTPVPITGVSLNKETTTLNISDQETLTATIAPSTATTSKTLTWTSSNSSVATVDSTGKVTAVGAGSATITVTTAVNGVSTTAYTDTCTVTVNAVVAMKLNRRNVILSTLDATAQLTSNKPSTTWTSSANSIATVASDGTITAVADGTAVITGTSGSMTATCTVDVNSKAVFVEDFEDNAVNLGNDYTPTVIEATNVYDGLYSAKATATGQYNGVKVVLDNSLGINSAVYNITSYVKNGGTGNITLMYTCPDPWGDYGTGVSAGSTWVKLDSGNITVPAGAVRSVRIRPSSAADGATSVYYIDNVVVTKVSGGDTGTGTITIPMFDTFNITNNSTINLTGKADNTTNFIDFYLNGTNFRGLANSTITDATLLDKFTTWSGVKEVVNAFEVSFTLTDATSMDTNNIKSNVLIQNLTTGGSWSGGSYKQFEGTAGVTSVSGSSVTFTQTIVIDDTTWNDVDTTAGKISVQLKNVVNGSAVAGTVTIRVIAKDQVVTPAPTPIFDEFYATQNNTFSLTGNAEGNTNWDDVYINGTNLRSAASGSGITDATLLDKFTTWAGVLEVVDAFEVTITINSGTASTGNLNANILVQNQATDNGWNGSYKQIPQDTGSASVSGTPVTITKIIVLSEQSWNSTDTLLGKIALQFNNVANTTAVTGTWSVKVIAKEEV